MTKPSSAHMARYRQDAGTGDGRLVAPTFLRNSPPMIARLAPWFADHSGNVLEIGAGTGQHAAAFGLAFPDLHWHASDPDLAHCQSASAWATFLRAPKRPVFQFDASAPWPTTLDDISPLTGIISMNVIHIAPLSVMEMIIKNAGQRLKPGGMLIFYGPFMENGHHTGEGNANFDKGLRAENPEWGIRDIDDIEVQANAAGLHRAALIHMPANNRLLIFKR